MDRAEVEKLAAIMVTHPDNAENVIITDSIVMADRWSHLGDIDSFPTAMRQQRQLDDEVGTTRRFPPFLAHHGFVEAHDPCFTATVLPSSPSGAPSQRRCDPPLLVCASNTRTLSTAKILLASLGVGSRRAGVAARLFRCSRCARAARPLGRPVAAVPKWKRFNECVGTDIAFIRAVRERQHAFLILMDPASDYIVAKYIMTSEGVRPPKPTAQTVRRVFQDGWWGVLMTPQRLQIDQDSGFRSDFSMICEAMNIQLLPAPADAHFSHGKVERRFPALKEMSTCVFHKMQVIDSDGARAAVPRMAEACNRLCNRDGFSPAQWVLGDEVHLLESAVGIDDPCVGTYVPEGSPFWHRLRLQEACEVSFRQARNSSALCRAALH